MLGVLIGAVIFGDLADRLGRRYILWLTSTGQFIFGIAVAFTFNYTSFVIVRFLLAMVSSGYLVVVFVYVTEYTGIKARTWASMHIHAFFAVGIMVVALVGYLARTCSVNFGGNEFLNLFLIGAVELPAYAIACLGMDRIGRRNTLIPFLIMSAVICGIVMLIPQDFNTLSIVANMAGKFAIGIAFGLIYLYTAELYPTVVRSLAVGSGSMMCRVGSVVAPFCVYLSSVWIFFPQLIVGIMAFLTGVLTLLLPETLGRPLTNTWAEAAELDDWVTKKSPSEKSLPAQNDATLEKMEMLNQGACGTD
ncbi:solute carrier family 22 member 16 [Crotalus adamanteus]|uniref:Solute carrier family 22 member 16 n=1 Tax=Crotalus adamanteus TaxID=8729 RepID=A0AAW1CAI6_CROAD